MTELSWDAAGTRYYETGIDHGVLYEPNEEGVYDSGVAWNGLVTVTESPQGAEATALYADNIKYLNLYSVETLEATIECYTYPPEFDTYNGIVTPTPGVAIGQQPRKSFGMSYRTRIGNDLDSQAGYRLHLLYGATASPSEKAYSTINDSPDAITFSYKVTTIAVPVTDNEPTSLITIDSTQVDAGDLADLELILYGSVGIDPRLPTPDEVIAIFGTGLTEATAETPGFVPATGVITIPTVTGIRYLRADTMAVLTAGAQAALAPGATRQIIAQPLAGYMFSAISDDDWSFTRDP